MSVTILRDLAHELQRRDGRTDRSGAEIAEDLRRVADELEHSLRRLPTRIDLTCPLCAATLDVGVSISTRLVHTAGNGRKGFITAEIGCGGIEHTCAIDHG